MSRRSLQRHVDPDFHSAVLKGLRRRPRHIPCRFLYDHRGAALFDEICRLEEYYPTRTECALLSRHAGDIAQLAGQGRRIVEFGGCSPTKARLLFDATKPRAYLPVDICREALAESAIGLADEMPGLSVQAIHADFTKPFRLPPGDGAVLGFFPGSTIGNMAPRQAIGFLRRTRRLLGRDGSMLVGVDLKKSHERLYAAYNDTRGITSAFILNLIERINRELGGDFDVTGFGHSAIYNAGHGRMELHIVSRRDQVAHAAGQRFIFRRGDAIHAEDSHKYSLGEFQTLARQAGFAPIAAWSDTDGLFSLHYLRPQG